MDLAGGKLRLDHPADHVARLTIDELEVGKLRVQDLEVVNEKR